jgi:hypothetical protein
MSDSEPLFLVVRLLHESLRGLRCLMVQNICLFVWPAWKSLNRPRRNYIMDCKKANKMQRKMWSSGSVLIMCKLLRLSNFAKTFGQQWQVAKLQNDKLDRCHFVKRVIIIFFTRQRPVVTLHTCTAATPSRFYSTIVLKHNRWWTAWKS